MSLQPHLSNSFVPDGVNLARVPHQRLMSLQPHLSNSFVPDGVNLARVTHFFCDLTTANAFMPYTRNKLNKKLFFLQVY